MKDSRLSYTGQTTSLWGAFRLLIIVCVILAPVPDFAQQYLITRFAGGGIPATPAAALIVPIASPQAIAVDGVGNQYVASENAVFKISVEGVLTRLAGSPGGGGYTGDGGPASAAQLNRPYGVAVDAEGNVYIADVGNSVVRKVGINGIITTIAGNGFEGYSGDGGPANSAELNYPFLIAVDGAGNLYITDYSNDRIRKVATNGIMTTVAGNGTYGYSGDGGPATMAELNDPLGISVDRVGNLYIADQSNARIRKVTADGIITTVAGNGTRGYSGDGGPATMAALGGASSVAVDAVGNLYIADGNRIREVAADGIIATIAGFGTGGYSGDGGPATMAELGDASSVAVDAVGNLYIADSSNNRIRKVAADGIITTVAGNGTAGYSGDGGPATNAEFGLFQQSELGIALDGWGNVYIADYNNHRVRKVASGGIITTVAGNGTQGYSGDGGLAVNAELNYPAGLAVDSAGNLYIADAQNARVRKIDSSGIITTVAGDGTVGFSGDGGPATSAKLNLPFGLSVDSTGNLYVADVANNRIRKVSPNGIITTVAGNGTGGYSGDGGPAISAQLSIVGSVATDADGNLYIADACAFGR